MSSPFPLLRLPRLILFEVFKSLRIGENLCSKKVSSQINNARLYSQKVIVDLDIFRKTIRVRSRNTDSFEIINCSNSGKSHNSNAQQFFVACCTVRVVSIPTGIQMFWENHPEGFLSVIRHILKMFQCKISTGEYCWRHELFQPILTELFDQQQEFEWITVGLHGLVDHNWLNRIFSYLRLVERLEIPSLNFLPPSSFIPTFPPWPKQEITIKTNSSWLTLDTLFTCPCSYIHIDSTYLENKDLDEIITHWKAGGLPNLKYLRIGSTKYKRDGDLILGMNPHELDDENLIPIQSDDGSKTAEVQIYRNSLIMITPPFLSLNF